MMLHLLDFSKSLKTNLRYESPPLLVTLYPFQSCLWDGPAEDIEDLQADLQAFPHSETVDGDLYGILPLPLVVSTEGV